MAFCTGFLRSSSEVRSKGVICTTSPWPLRRTPVRTEKVNHRRPRRPVPQNVPDAANIAPYCLAAVGDAVTGTGAFFGVLT